MAKVNKMSMDDYAGYDSVPTGEYPSAGTVAVPAGASDPSMWSKFGSMTEGSGDVIASLAGKYADYEKQMAENRAQGMINQAAAKWSGFQPGLMNMVKPINNPNPVAMAMEGVSTAPKYWYDIGKMYEARKAAKAGDDGLMEKLKKQEAERVVNAAVAGK